MVRFVRGTVSCLSVTVLSVVAACAADPTEELLLALKEWETATADVPPLPPDNALATYRDTHNAHELEAAAELLGPVVARRLVEEYRWTLVRSESGEIRLHGEPRDVTTSLFFSGVDVVLVRATHRPASIQFVGVEGAPLPLMIAMATDRAMNAPEAARQSDIQLVVNVTEPRDEPAPPRPRDLESILKRWQEALSHIETAEIRFHRYVCDHTCGSETRSTGRLLFEAPNRGTYDIEPADLATDGQPARTDRGGTKYSLHNERPMRFQWDGARLWIVYLDEKLYDVWTIPETPLAGKRPRWGLWGLFGPQSCSPALFLPGVLDLSDEGFLNRFEWTLVRDDDRGVLLRSVPVNVQDRAEYKKLEFLIDHNTSRTRATRIVVADGNKEMVHVLQYVSVNDDQFSRRSWVPDVSGLKLNFSEDEMDTGNKH